MNGFGGPPRLDRVPAIWPTDAAKLLDCGLELRTVRDLVDQVRLGEGLEALSERSGVPVEQLRFYFHLSERACSKARVKKRGVWGLLALAILTTLMAFIWAPPTLERPEEKRYAELYAWYQADSVGLTAELDEIIALYRDAIGGDADAASAARAQLAARVGPDAMVGDSLSSYLANIVNLRSATYHDAAVRLAAEGDPERADALYQEAQKLNFLLRGTDSHEEYARENYRRVMTERAEVGTELRLRSIQSDIDTRSAEVDRRLSDVRTDLASQGEVLASSIGVINETLGDHTQKLDSLIGLMGADPSEVDPPEDSSATVSVLPDSLRRVLDERPTVADPEEAERVIEAAWPQRLQGDRTVEVRLFIDEEGRAQDPTVFTTSGDPRLDSAAVDAVRDIRFNPAMSGGEPIGVWVTLPVTFSSRQTPEVQARSEPAFWDTYRDMARELNAVVLAIDEAGARRIANDLAGSRSLLDEARELSEAPALRRCDDPRAWMDQTARAWSQEMRSVAEAMCANRRSLRRQMTVAERLLSRRRNGDLETGARSNESVATWDSAQAAYDNGRERIRDLLSRIQERRDGGTR